jgi:hypothetical protein
VKSTCDQFEGD